MYILIDIGGTNTRVAKTEDKENLGESIIFETPQDFNAWLEVAKTAIATLVQEKPILAIVVGVPATFKDNKSVINVAPNLPLWQGVPLKQILAETFSCEATLENDTALVGLGEAIFGAGKGHDIVAYLTLSTGVNGVKIVDGKIDKNKYGYEIGHHIIDQGKDIEYFIGGKSLETRFGIPSKENKDPELWKEVNYYTGVLAANTTMYWSPSIIIFGGPVTNDINIDEVTLTAKSIATRYEVLPIFVKSTLGALGGLYGGMAYLKTRN